MGDQLKIVHVVSGFDIDFPGGITNYVRTLAESQVVRGHEVTVIDGASGKRKHPGGYMVIGYQGNIQPFVVSCKDDPEGTGRLNAAIATESPDLVHFHLTIGFGEDFYERFAAAGMPYVVSMHDYYLICPRFTMMNWQGKNCGGPEQRKCETCIGKLDQVDVLYKASRRLHVPLPRIPSKAVTERNEKVGSFLRAAAVVLPVSERVRELSAGPYPDLNYVVSHIGNSSAVAERPKRVPSPQLRLTFIGVLSEHKGAELFIGLANGVQRSDVEFHFYGRADSRWAKAAEKAGIIMHGSYAPEDLPGIMAATDLGVALPIWEDNGPQVVMEFTNYGVPVLATRMGGIPDFVTADNGHLFDPASLVEAVAYVEGASTDDLRRKANRIPRLTTPADHQLDIEKIYASALQTA